MKVIYFRHFSRIHGGVLGLCLIVMITGTLQGQDNRLTYEHPDRPPSLKELMQWKEVFTYEVKYGFFKLGEIQTTIVQDTTFQGQQAWWLKSIITSNSSIPFVGKEEKHYNTFFVETDSLPFTVVYWRDDVENEKFNQERYRFDYDQQKVYFSESGKPIDTLEVTEPSSSGQLIFYYSRLFAGTNKSYRLPVYLKREKGYIDASNSSKIERQDYDAFKKPVKIYYSEGEADIDGPFGFRGEFKAWYIADDLRIPAEAHAKVWLGNVKVRLTDYKKVLRNE